MKIVEYNKELHGEIKPAPAEFIAAIKALPVEEQIEHFRLVEGFSRGERAYGVESVNSQYSSAKKLTESSYCHAVLVKDGVIVGILTHSECCSEFAAYPNETYFIYSTEDNNGAGYKTYDEYMTLICVLDEKDEEHQ